MISVSNTQDRGVFRVVFEHKSYEVFTLMMCVGYYLSRLRGTESLLIHHFNSFNSNGEERIASPYQRDSLDNALRNTIERMKLPYTVRRVGLDSLVEPLPAEKKAEAQKQIAAMFDDWK